MTPYPPSITPPLRLVKLPGPNIKTQTKITTLLMCKWCKGCCGAVTTQRGEASYAPGPVVRAPRGEENAIRRRFPSSLLLLSSRPYLVPPFFLYYYRPYVSRPFSLPPVILTCRANGSYNCGHQHDHHHSHLPPCLRYMLTWTSK